MTGSGRELVRARGNPLGAVTLGAQALGLRRPRDVRDLCLAMTFASNLQMLLHWEDRNSMAHSIEARVPFLDHPLVEFSLALGGAHKFVGADTKRVLRRAMADTLPRAISERRDKLGFATPEETWFRGPLADAMGDRVEATLARYPELFNAAGVRAFAADMLEGRKPIDFALVADRQPRPVGRAFRRGAAALEAPAPAATIFATPSAKGVKRCAGMRRFSRVRSA